MSNISSHPKLSHKRKRELTTQLNDYRFFAVVERREPLEQNVMHLLKFVQPQFVDFGAFCLAIVNVLALKRALFVHDCFLAWFDDLTADCRARMRLSKLRDVLWRVFIVLGRRMPATNKVLACLSNVAERADYTEAAYEFLDSLDYAPLQK